MRKLARNSLFGSLAGLSTALGAFLSMVVVARILGATGTGVVAYTLWLLTLAVTLGDLGIYQVLSRYLPELTAKSEAAKADALASFLVRAGIAVAVVGALLLVAVAHWLPPPAQSSASFWWIVGVLFAAQLISSCAMGYLRGMQQFDAAAKLTVIGLPLQIASVAVGAFVAGPEGALIGFGAGYVLPLKTAFTVARRRASASGVSLRRALPFALYSWGTALVLAIVWSRLEFFFLQRFHGVEAVALMTVGFTFSNLAAQVPLLLTAGLLPHFSERFGTGAEEQLRRSYRSATRGIAFILFPACMVLAGLVPALIPLVYGEAFAAAIPAAMVLVACAAIGAVGAAGSQLLYAHERADFLFASGLLGAVLSVAGGLLVIPAHGVMGAAIWRGAVHAVMLSVGFWFIWSRLGYAVPTVNLLKLLLASMCAGVVAYVCVREIPHVLISLPLAVGLAAITYAAGVRMTGAMADEDIEALCQIADALPERVRSIAKLGLAFLFPSRSAAAEASVPGAFLLARVRARAASRLRRGLP